MKRLLLTIMIVVVGSASSVSAGDVRSTRPECGNLTESECQAEESVSLTDNGQGNWPSCPDPLNGWCVQSGPSYNGIPLSEYERRTTTTTRIQLAPTQVLTRPERVMELPRTK